MTNDRNQNSEGQFLHYLNTLIRARLLEFFKKKDAMANEDKFIRINEFYGKILYDVCFGVEPTYEQFSGMKLKQSDESIFQGALYLHNKWKGAGLSGAATNYCQYVNRLLDGKVFGFIPRGKTLPPDFCQYEQAILNKVQAIKATGTAQSNTVLKARPVL